MDIMIGIGIVIMILGIFMGGYYKLIIRMLNNEHYNTNKPCSNNYSSLLSEKEEKKMNIILWTIGLLTIIGLWVITYLGETL